LIRVKAPSGRGTDQPVEPSTGEAPFGEGDQSCVGYTCVDPRVRVGYGGPMPPEATISPALEATLRRFEAATLGPEWDPGETVGAAGRPPPATTSRHSLRTAGGRDL